MSLQTITKIAWFVIPMLFSAGCSSVSYSGAEHAQIEPENAGFQQAEVVARISSKEINESSGLAVSKCQSDVFWTHNDSGDGPFLYAFDSNGESLGKFRIPNVRNVDWEDISAIKNQAGECLLYIGEFGDNERKRDVHEIYRVPEPGILSKVGTGEPVSLQPVDVMQFRYPAGRHDAEALLVHPLTNAIFVVTKEFNGPAKVYQLDATFGSGQVQTAAAIAELSLPASPEGFVTGGDISADGKRVALCDYYAGYELLLPQNTEDFNEIWRQKAAAFDLGPRAIGESIAYWIDGNSVFATTEKINTPLIRVIRK